MQRIAHRLPILAAILWGGGLLACGGGSPAGDEGEPAAEEGTSGEDQAQADAPVDPAAARLLAEGTAAPDFELPDQSGQLRSLAAERGRPVVLYFYPRDATPGCTTEACAFRDAWQRYEEAGVQVYGVSVDSVDSHRAFAEEHELPFPLIADEDGEVSRAYGVYEDAGYARRVTYLIGPDGTVRHVFDLVDPAVHADEVLETIARVLR